MALPRSADLGHLLRSRPCHSGQSQLVLLVEQLDQAPAAKGGDEALGQALHAQALIQGAGQGQADTREYHVGRIVGGEARNAEVKRWASLGAGIVLRALFLVGGFVLFTLVAAYFGEEMRLLLGA